VPRPNSRQFRLALSLGIVLGIGATATTAAWIDNVSVTGTTVGTVTPTAPVVSCGASGVHIVTLNWTAVPNATGYRLFYDTGGSATEDVPSTTTSKTFNNQGDHGTFWVRTLYNPWTSPASNTKTYDAIGQGACN
jgi:ABC-type dipeptide/oligopeptide/nickel transport system permease component